jgi:heme A synthase
MLIGGAMIVVKKKQPVAAAALGIMILAAAVLTYALRLIAQLGSYSELTNTVKDVAVAGGLLVLAGLLTTKSRAAEAAGTDRELVHYRVQ